MRIRSIDKRGHHLGLAATDAHVTLSVLVARQRQTLLTDQCMTV